MILSLELNGTLEAGRLFDDGAGEVVFSPEDVAEAHVEGAFVHPDSGTLIALDDRRLLTWWRGVGAE